MKIGFTALLLLSLCVQQRKNNNPSSTSFESNSHNNVKQAVCEAARYAPPMYATRCRPAPAHTRLTPGLRHPAQLASSSCGHHEYSRCTRQTDRRPTSDAYHRLNNTPYGGGHNNTPASIIRNYQTISDTHSLNVD